SERLPDGDFHPAVWYAFTGARPRLVPSRSDSDHMDESARFRCGEYLRIAAGWASPRSYDCSNPSEMHSFTEMTAG
ncbi:MAG: hypothetical protein O2960_26295, partial [Verrucomicrobia bacterium]|nr:hypothetical protein [Verrucomicrobiota bacterium]